MITLATAKQHLRLPSDYTAEDAVLQAIINAVTSYVTDLTGIQNNIDAPATYDLACQLLIASQYENREATNERHLTKTPYGLDMLLATLRPAEGLI